MTKRGRVRRCLPQYSKAERTGLGDLLTTTEKKHCARRSQRARKVDRRMSWKPHYYVVKGEDGFKKINRIVSRQTRTE
jgi:hypothetical protein